MNRGTLLATFLAAFLASPVFADPPPTPAAGSEHFSPPLQIPEAENLFFRNQSTLQFMSGAYFAPSGLGPRTPTFDFLTEQIRLGWQHGDPCGPGLLRGNLETLLELNVCPVTDGFGSMVAGPSLMSRYNFVQPGWDLVPYLQGGAGLGFNDAYKDQTQRAIGEGMEFFLEAGLGAHLRLGESWSLDAEAELIHISNGRLSQRNQGINAVGGSVGVTWFLR